MSNQKITIRLKSTDSGLIDRSAGSITAAAQRTGARVIGPVPLKTKKERITILISPHVNSNAVDQYETRTHSRLIMIEEPNDRTVDDLMKLDLPAGVDVQISVH